MGRSSEFLRADRAGARPDRSRRLEFEGLELRRLLAVGIREFPIPTPNSNPFWITSGPGSALYLTAGGTSQIVEYTPSTQGFKSFSIPGGNLGSQGTIAAGSDGNLYFTSSNGSAIGQFNPAVGFTQSIPVPTASVGTSYITTG